MAPGASTAKLYDISGKKVFVAGHRGMVGAAITRRLEKNDVELIAAGRDVLDLRDQAATRAFIADRRPEVIFMSAATVGGIVANNSRPAEFLYDNLAMECSVFDAALRADVERVVFLGSSCIYPKFAEQPLREEALLTGPLEPTNEWYAIAKIAGLKLAEAYRRQYGRRDISAMPTNLYGPGDNFNLQNSHVIPALLRKAHDAKLAGAAEMSVWGTGEVRREFLYVEDLADALVFLAERYDDAGHINVGVGEDVRIRDLVSEVMRAVGYDGAAAYDTSKPDGTPRKLMDVSKLSALGWRASTSLQDGLAKSYTWFLDNADALRV
ncbi:MAG: GDP-L-fucose synthase [Pseudomonadota bacterium]